ncbi:MAG: hypothetical protein AAB225_22250 [Acidobacteriota bacterium]
MKGPSAQGMQNYACHCLGLKSYLERPGDGRTYKQPCSFCHPVKDNKGAVHGSLHHFAMITVVGTGLTLPVDVADKLELPVVARLKDNLLELRAAVEARFHPGTPVIEVPHANWREVYVRDPGAIDVPS